MSKCYARQYSDQMQCGRCGLAWDTNDPAPPACAPVIDRRAIPTRRKTTEVRRVEEAMAAIGARLVERPPTVSIYGCWNRPRPALGAVTHLAQNGYLFDRMPRVIEIRHTLSTDCRYDKRATDRNCVGCKWGTE